MRVFTIIIIILAVIVVFAGLGFLYFTSLLNAPQTGASVKTVTFEITSGQGVKEISKNLHTAGLIRSATAFEYYVWMEGVGSDIQAGKYELNTGQKASAIIEKITKGDVTENEVEFQVLEGWSMVDIAEQYGETFSSLQNKSLSALKEDFLKAAATTDSRKLIPGEAYSFLSDKPKTAGLEGYLFPDTYRLYDTATPSQVVQKMLDNFGDKVTDELRQKISAQGLTLFQGVTLASIIEKEVRTDQDKKIVADLFLRRMAAGIPLQSDATVNYVTGKSALQPTIDDTKTESLYNTYLHQGLPPGPICNPSLASLAAVASPQPNEYFYYLNTPEGETIFSKTFEEHKLNKAKYLQ